MNECTDCDCSGNGKCSTCHGTGLEQDVIDAFSDAIVGDSQDCKDCGGDGKCQTCDGKGYVED